MKYTREAYDYSYAKLSRMTLSKKVPLAHRRNKDKVGDFALHITKSSSTYISCMPNMYATLKREREKKKKEMEE